MNDILSIIGTIASVGSVPLSIYLFIKSKEDKIDKTKREIVRILSHQIGDRRKLTSFEIQAVINSKTQENKVSQNKIHINEIVEDLVSDTISNPLLNSNIKDEILEELRKVYYKNEVYLKIESIERKTKASSSKEMDEELAREIKDLLAKTKESIYHEVENRTKRYSDLFASIATAATLTFAITAVVGKANYDKLSTPIYEFLAANDFYIAIATGIVISIVSGIILLLSRKTKK